MRIRFLRSCAVNGAHVSEGEVRDVPDDVARELVNRCRAAPLGDVMVETREPVIEAREPLTTETANPIVENKPRRGRPPKV